MRQFYVCQTQQNVYKTTKSFKVQWLELKTAPDLFEMSYYDSVEAGAVLTEVRIEKAKEKNLWRLLAIDIERVEKILELAKKKEKGEWDENQALPPILTMELDTSRGDEESNPKMKTINHPLQQPRTSSKGHEGHERQERSSRVKPIATVQLKTKSALKQAKQEATKGTGGQKGRPRRTPAATPNNAKATKKTKKVF
ncbi:uncharacterized protein [Amphiura filiformis]|uniref:uncharacterized protein n=1 Tax=Amphiura filiformis TaxID=82378 RepID=UPI003B220E5E